MTVSETRIEKDSMGEFEVPSKAYFGAQTARAVANFPISGVRFPRPFIQALGAIKLAAAEVNVERGLLEPAHRDAIVRAAQEVIDGKLDDHFVIDIYQTGSGTSTNMNTNEVISNRAIEQLGGVIGSKSPIHPNDHVNKSQSSNDVIPAAMHVAAAVVLERDLIPALKELHAELGKKAREWDEIVKIGRTHLMDATPIRLGQEASGWARQVELGIERLESVKPRLLELAIGGTAVGTGINSPEGFGRDVAAKLAARFDLPFVEARNHFEAQGSQDGITELGNQLATVATSLLKIANDVRWLSSGPRCGIGELALPAVQPGSSIMPGKVNPVMCEQLIMVCAQVIGNATTINIANTHGNLDLNVMLPVMARNSLESLTYLASSVRAFNDRAIKGMTANKQRAESLVEWSMSMVTSLVPVIGYDRAAAIAKEAVHENKTVRQLCIEQAVLPESELDDLLDPRKMTEPGIGQAGSNKFVTILERWLKPQLAVQMYTVRDFTKSQAALRETLRKLYSIGYRAVQMSAVGAMNGDNPEVTPKMARSMLDDLGMKCIATHRSWDSLAKETSKEIDFHQTLGCNFTAIGSLPGEYGSRGAQGYRDFLSDSAPVIAQLKAAGIRFGYHNHAHELQRFEFVSGTPRTLFDIFIDDGGPDLCMELDLYWLTHAGANPERIVERCAGRLPVIHVKDKEVADGQPVMSPVGEGNLDWTNLIPACEKAGVEWYAVEQDECRRDPFDCLRSSYEFLSRF